MTAKTRARQARIAAGLSVEQAAKIARICPAYLRRVEREGAPFSLAQRLARLYGVGIDVFLNFREGRGTSRKRASRGSGKLPEATTHNVDV
jgi:transcriptional regulator with XRE-family HTH domain